VSKNGFTWAILLRKPQSWLNHTVFLKSSREPEHWVSSAWKPNPLRDMFFLFLVFVFRKLVCKKFEQNNNYYREYRTVPRGPYLVNPALSTISIYLVIITLQSHIKVSERAFECEHKLGTDQDKRDPGIRVFYQRNIWIFSKNEYFAKTSFRVFIFCNFAIHFFVILLFFCYFL